MTESIIVFEHRQRKSKINIYEAAQIHNIVPYIQSILEHRIAEPYEMLSDCSKIENEYTLPIMYDLAIEEI